MTSCSLAEIDRFVAGLGRRGARRTAAGGSPVELTTLDGPPRRPARWSSFRPIMHRSSEHGKEVRIPLAEVLDLRTVRPKPAVPPDPRRPELTLTDGSRLYWTALRVSDRQVSVETAQLGKFSLPSDRGEQHPVGLRSTGRSPTPGRTCRPAK